MPVKPSIFCWAAWVGQAGLVSIIQGFFTVGWLRNGFLFWRKENRKVNIKMTSQLYKLPLQTCIPPNWILAIKHPSGEEKLECYALCCLKKLISKSATRQLLVLFSTLETFLHIFKKNQKIVRYIPEWIFPWAVRFDLEEKDLLQRSQECLASPECMWSIWDSKLLKCPNSFIQKLQTKGFFSEPAIAAIDGDEAIKKNQFKP